MMTAWDQIRSQARTHTSRDGITRVIDQMRPNEPESIKDYRETNQRRITRSSVNSWFSMVSRIFTNSGISIGDSSERLEEYLDTYPFKFNQKEFGLMDWMYNIALMYSVEDPNGLFLVYPKKENYENTLEFALPVVKFFNSNELKGTIGSSIYFAIDLGKNLHEHWVIDSNTITVSRDVQTKNGLIVEDVFSYNHNIGQIPIIGTISNTITFGNSDLINESLLAGSFEFYDECLSQFSDNQAVTIQHNFPIRLIKDIPCFAEGCKNGRVNNNGEIKECSTCHGKGHLGDISPYHTIVVPDKILGETSNGRDPIMYVSPPAETISASYERAFDLLKKGNMDAGIDIVGSETESGVSRNMRLEEKQDKLLMLANKFKMFAEQMLYLMECYLVTSEAARVIPTINVPRAIQVKSAEMLKEEAINSPISDRFNSFMRFVKEKYGSDVFMCDIYEAAYAECPILLLNQAELETRLVSGIYSGFDIYKADVFVQRLMKNCEDYEVTNEAIALTNEQIKRSFTEKI